MNMKQKKKGFTLVELIVALVIMAILAAVAIPTMLGYVNKARETQAMAEARTCLLAAQTLGSEACARGEEPPKADDAALRTLAEIPASAKITTLEWDDSRQAVVRKMVYLASNGITVVYENGVFTVGEAAAEQSFAQLETMDKLRDVIGNRSTMDSGAGQFPGSETDKLVKDLKAAGLDLEAMGAVTWSYQRNGNEKFLYWTPVDIEDSNLKVGDTIPAMRYNFTTGTYTVFNVKIGYGNYSNRNKEYLVLGSVVGSVYPGKQDYESMVEIYNDAVAKKAAAS